MKQRFRWVQQKINWERWTGKDCWRETLLNRLSWTHLPFHRQAMLSFDSKLTIRAIGYCAVALDCILKTVWLWYLKSATRINFPCNPNRGQNAITKTLKSKHLSKNLFYYIELAIAKANLSWHFRNKNL